MRLCTGLVVLLVFCAGCVKRKPVAPGLAYTLEEKSGYGLLVPSLASEPNGSDFRTTLVPLGGDGPRKDTSFRQRCVIHGSVFSLDPAPGDFAGRWVVKSLSEEGWARRAGELNVRAEWSGFVQRLQELERSSCFSRKENFFAARRMIAESIAVPATEAPFFLYSFGGTGFVNLAPGMEVKIERNSRQMQAGMRGSYGSAIEAYYTVTASGDGVALRLSRVTNRKGAGSDEIFELARRFQSKEMLRLFLQSVGVSGLTPAVLLGTNRTGDLEAATEEIARDRSCPASTGARRDCLLFGQGTAVSLMSAVTVNGKPETVPFGVSVGQILTGPAKGTPGDAIQTVSLSRRLVGGGYADVRFPRTLEGVQQIVLLPGDMLTW